MKKLTKSNDRIIAGVCGGIAEYFGFDATIVRLVTAALALFTAIVPSVILYLIAAMIIPDASPKKTVDDGRAFLLESIR
jgi:phage shock protein C